MERALELLLQIITKLLLQIITKLHKGSQPLAGNTQREGMREELSQDRSYKYSIPRSSYFILLDHKVLTFWL